MKKGSILTAFILVFSIQNNGHSIENLQYESKEEKSTLDAGIEMGALNTAGTSFTGMGFKIGYSYAINEKFAFNANLILMGTLTGGLGFLYTGIVANLEYAILGQFQNFKTTLTHGGVVIFSEKAKKENIFSLNIGPEQLFFNGSKSVYPVTGVGIAPTYRFQLFSQPLKSSLRYSMLMANNVTFLAFFLSLSTDFNL